MVRALLFGLGVLPLVMVFASISTPELGVGPPVYERVPETWLKLSDCVATAQIVVTKETPTKFSADNSKTPWEWRVQGDLRVQEVLYGKQWPEAVPFETTKRLGWDDGEPNGLQRALMMHSEGKRLLTIAFLGHQDGHWTVLEVLPVGEPKEAIVSAIRRMIALEEKAEAKGLVEDLKLLLGSEHPMLLRQYAVRKLLSIEEPPSVVERVSIVRSALEDEATRDETSSFWGYCFGALKYHIDRVLIHKESDPISGPALDAVLDMLGNSRDGRILRRCLKEIEWISPWAVKNEEVRGKVLKTLKATTELPELRRLDRMNQAEFEKVRAQLLRAYGGM